MKKTLISFILALLSVGLFAAQRSVNEAAAIAAKVNNPALHKISKHSASAAPQRPSTSVRLVRTQNQPMSDKAAFYVFDREDQGFVIVSADDNTRDILAYSNQGSFPEQVPANVQFLLDYMAERIASSGKKGKTAALTASYTPVIPLLDGIQWNQDEPYWNKCPIDKNGDRAYTGCVATATAQVMRYWKWPTKGTGSHSYTAKNVSGTLSANFGTTTYDWANMPKTTSGYTTTAQKNAVATLTYHVGVAIEMDYGGETIGGSGAYTNDVATALVNYFGYKNTLEYVNTYDWYYGRQVESASTTAQRMREDLTKGHPVIVSGASEGASSGHAFVFEGYDENGLFYVNWGWGGSYNGYYAIDDLEPGGSGIGGNGAGYSHYLEYIIGIEPNGSVTPPTPSTPKNISGLQYGDAVYRAYNGSPLWDIDLYKGYNNGYIYPELYVIFYAKSKTSLSGTYNLLYVEYTTTTGKIIGGNNGRITISFTKDGKYHIEGSFYGDDGNAYTFDQTITLNGAYDSDNDYAEITLVEPTDHPIVKRDTIDVISNKMTYSEYIASNAAVQYYAGNDAGYTQFCVTSKNASSVFGTFDVWADYSWIKFTETTSTDIKEGKITVTEEQTGVRLTGYVIGNDEKYYRLNWFMAAGILSYITYTATEKLPETINYDSNGLHTNAFNVSITSHDFSNGIGTITFADEVTEIGERAFYNCSGLTTIDIPNSVTTIEWGAFYNCSGLTSITIPNFVTTIGQMAFNGCSGLTSVVIPNSVTTIKSSAFSECSGLTSIVIPNSVTTIGGYAFYHCSGLTSIDIPNSITTIEDGTFNGCSGLNSIVIPNSVTTIGMYAFYGCSGLASVTIPNSIITIGKWAFDDCYNLTSIEIPNSVTTIDTGAFMFCYSLTSVTVRWTDVNKLPIMGDYVFEGIVNGYGPSGATLHVPEGTKSIYQAADQWKDFGTIKDGINDDEPVVGQRFEVDKIWYEITSLGQTNTVKVYWYDNYSSPTLVIPASVSYKDYTFAVTEIYGWTFANNANITSIVLPNTLVTIGEGAFYGCANLTNVTAPALFFDVPESDWNSYSKQFASVVVNGGELNEDALQYINRSYKTLKTLDVSAVTNTEFADEAFEGYYNLETLLLPSSLESISYMMVAGCVNIKSIDIPASVTEIGQRAFEDCRSIVTINFKGNLLKKIDNWAFYNAHQLKNLTLPNGVEEIGDAAFYGCVDMENLEIPHSVKHIGDNSFALCSKLSKITVHSVTPPTIEAKTFYEVNRQIPVYVPVNVVDDYKQADYWKEFNIIGNGTPTNFESVYGSQPTMHKVLRDGQILLERNNTTYTLTGQKVR